MQTVLDIGGRLAFDTPRTRSSEAFVSLTDRAIQALLQRRLGQEIERQAWGSAYADHDLVFTREDGSPLRPEHVTRRLDAFPVLPGCDLSACTTSAMEPRH